MKRLTMFLSLLIMTFTTAMAEDPAIMKIKEDKAYTIKFIEKEGFAYYNTTENNLKAKNADNTASIIYHFVFTNAGTDVTGRQLYYISPKNAPEYFAYNTGSYNGVENTSADVGLTNDISIKEDKGKWYIFDQNGTHFITPAWKENGTYTRGGCCWNRGNTTDAELSMWGRGTDDPNFDGDNSLAITLVEENNDITTETPVNDINEFVSGKIYTFESKRGWLVAGTDYVYNSVKMGTDANASTNNVNCQWILYKNDNGTYLYNIGVGRFISANADNRNVIPLSTTPTTSSVEFKKSTVDEYPIIIGVDNCAINQNPDNTNYPYGAILWSDGWTDSGRYGDEGSCHKAICIGNASEEIMNDIAARAEVYEETANGSELFVTRSGDIPYRIPYRIPAIAQASNGNLIAVADYRHSGKDIGVEKNGRIDLHARISENNGADWGSTFTIVEGKGAASPDSMHVGFGDPCIVADRESNRVLLLSCAGNVSFQAGTRNIHQNIARFYSEDNGKTWSEPVDIADAIYSMWDNNSNHGPAKAMFVGSGKIHQSRYVKVNDYYRLYCAVLLRNNKDAYTNFVLYSDDFGGSWDVLGGVENAPIPSDGDEPKVEELPNGNIVISSRCNGGRHFNIFTFTDAEKAEGSWGTRATSNSNNNGVAATGNSCNGEIMILPAKSTKEDKNVWIALQSVPFGNGRNNVGIYYKVLESEEDYNTPANFAKDWDGRLKVSTIGSAYSTMCLQNNGTLAFLYEEETYGAQYTIQYKNLTLENITAGNYSMGKVFKITYKIGNDIIGTAEYAEGEKIAAINAPQKEGHSFTWNDLPAHMPAEDITIFGTYTPNTYTVTYKIGEEVIKTESVTYGNALLLPEAPAKEGHTFNGWSEIPQTMPATDITINGTYTANTYTVTYKVDGEVYKTDNVAYGSNITVAEAPVKEGHTFSGWSDTPETMPANDITIEGSFTINIYKVTFVTDTIEYSCDSIEYGAEIVLPEIPEKEGHTFAWNNAPATMPATDITINGTYTANTYTVTYKVDGEVYKTDSVTYGCEITTPEAPEKEGYTFYYWNDVPATMPAEDITVEGVYTANIYAITYMVEGEVYKTDSVAYGSDITLAEAPEKEGHTFNGWSEAPATMPANDITIEGSFTINIYKVTFVTDTIEYSCDSIEYGAKITLPEIPEKEGCTFVWEHAPATMPAADTTIKGNYIPNMYAVTYMVEGEVYKTDSVAYGSNITPAEAPEKEGHSFAGWKEIPATMPAKDIIIEGSFTANSYKVTYIIDEEVYFTTTVKYGAKIPVLDEPVKDGCIFSGWSEIPETMPAEDIVITGSFTDVETSIEMVTDSNTAIVYNIKGERIVDTRNLERGLYIINGKVVLVK